MSKLKCVLFSAAVLLTAVSSVQAQADTTGNGRKLSPAETEMKKKVEGGVIWAGKQIKAVDERNAILKKRGESTKQNEAQKKYWDAQLELNSKLRALLESGDFGKPVWNDTYATHTKIVESLRAAAYPAGGTETAQADGEKPAKPAKPTCANEDIEVLTNTAVKTIVVPGLGKTEGNAVCNATEQKVCLVSAKCRDKKIRGTFAKAYFAETDGNCSRTPAANKFMTADVGAFTPVVVNEVPAQQGDGTSTPAEPEVPKNP